MNEELSTLPGAPEKQSTGSKIMSKLVIASLVVIALIIGLFMYWSLQSDKVLVIKETPVPTRTIRDHPTAGGVVFLTVDYCKEVNATGIVRTSFVSPSREIFLPVSKDNSEKGCKEVEIPVLIPKDIPPDTYTVKIRGTYDINPIKKGIVTEFESRPFTVDPTTPTNDR